MVFPLWCAEVWQRRRIGGDGGKPVIEDDMELGSNCASVEAEDKGDRGCMFGAHADKDLSLGARFPTWKLLAIGDLLVEDVDGTSRNMEVLELGVGPPSLGEDIMGAQTRGLVGHLVVQQDGMLYCQGPEPCVGDIRPVDGRVKHHGPRNAHHSLDASLGYSIVVMGSNTCKLGDLSEVLKMGTVLFRHEG